MYPKGVCCFLSLEVFKQNIISRHYLINLSDCIVQKVHMKDLSFSMG